MIEEFEYDGKWWLPDKPEEKISGTLTFAPNEGAILKLIGSFKDIKDIGVILEPEIILGDPTEGLVTLYGCWEKTSNLSGSGQLTSSFSANVAFVGAHFQKKEDISFKKLSVIYSYLDEWVNISGFDIKDPLGKVVIKYNRPERIKATLDNNYKIFIDFRRTGPKLVPVQKEVSINQITYIGIEPSEPKSFQEYLNMMSHLGNLLSLGVTQPVYPLAIEGTTEINKQIRNGRTYYPPVKIFYGLQDIPRTSKRVYARDMLFTFKDLSDNLTDFIRNWFEKHESLQPVYDLYFGTLYNPRMYLRHKFLSLAQAIETYHRRTAKNFELPEEEHNRRIEEILNSVLQNHRDWVKDELEYSNEPSLRKRLREILDKYSGLADRLIEGKKGFINKVVNTRNYFIHYNPSLKAKAATGEELYWITEKLKILLEVCLLGELGFNLDDIKKLFSRNRRYRHVLHMQ